MNKQKIFAFPNTLWNEIATEKSHIMSKFLPLRSEWHKSRAQREPYEQHNLDTSFRENFESLQPFFLRRSLPYLAEQAQQTLATLQDLVLKGASAEKLNDYELGPFNLAMAVKSFDEFSDTTQQSLAFNIIQLTTIAGANQATQKAYAGNGGATCIYWLLEYMGEYPHIHESCYELICLLLDLELECTQEAEYLLRILVQSCPKEQAVPLNHKKVAMRLMTQITAGDHYLSLPGTVMLTVEKELWEFLPILLPTANCMREAVGKIQQGITQQQTQKMVNAFTRRKVSRKHFKTFFAHHWLTQHIVQQFPEVIFQLVKRREKIILETFLKKYRTETLALRNEKHNTLLHEAVLTRGCMDKIISLLITTGIDRGITNKNGDTAYDIAVKNNKHGVVHLLKTT
ncbi:ankyrin repeat domain-containing protein [Candidatus Uabimicrobium amorphum]|uniref:Ankyrin repeat domain-containing protein n=1 Tax=Uabimicrobium amorphum TaxID=2596890 RepID=A0A5S9IT55_UABAM|nr:ankyrin repeat domain-containing protein [Candidatus Uabimicrobium amorphum]BBM87267.1 hypothetical protein UABAM_05670 [Candidatus Uabimicrobium amorphum]